MRRALQRHRLLTLPHDEHRNLLLPCQLAQTLFTSPSNSAEAETVTTDGSGSADGGGADVRFLQLLSQRFAPTVAGGEQQPQQQEAQSAARPLLATLPGSAQLMERAVPERPPTQPLYDIPNFLAVEHPEHGVHPSNPAYDWRTWARHNLRTKPAPGRARSAPSAANAAAAAGAEAAGSTSTSRRGRTAAAVQHPGAAVEYDADAREQLALLLQMDQHMALPASREAILRMAELELAHLWYWQQQQQQQQGGGSRGIAADGNGHQGHYQQQQQHSAEGPGEASRAAAPYSSAPPSQGDSSSGPAAGTASSGSSSSSGKSARLSAADPASPSSSDEDEAGAQAAQAQAAPQGEEGDGDDLWARVDATLKKKQEQAAGRAGQRPGAAGAEGAAGAGADGGVGVTLPGGHVLRPEVWSLLEAASRGHSGSGSVNVRGLSAFFSDYRLQQRDRDEGSAEQALRILHSFGYLRKPVNALASQERRQKPPLAAMQLDPGSGPYWADTPELQYDSNTADYVIRQVNMMRRKEEAPADGRASMSAAIASLGAAARSPAAGPPATPMLTLLMDYLSVKYQDLLHTWELHARLQEAADVAARRAARGSATLTVQTTAPTLPPSLAALLERTWPADSSSSSDAGALPWQDARGLMTAHGLQVAEAAGGSAVSGQDVRQQVAGVFGPLLERAAARHRALMAAGGGGGAAGSAAAPGRGGVDWGSSGVVVFRETLTLDASSAYKDGSHDARVDLEFDVARLVALEPALGGAWGRGFLQRLLREGSADTAAGAAAGRQQGGGYAPRRRKVGPRAHEAVLAAAYPINVETSYDDRTGTARLSTARYGSREANRKLLTEHFASLLRATATAAGAGGAGAAAPAAAAT